MNNKWLLLLLIPVVIILVIVIIFLVERSKVDFHEEDGTSISIIGGADGPTSIFLAGKIGGNDSESNIEAEENCCSISSTLAILVRKCHGRI